MVPQFDSGAAVQSSQIARRRGTGSSRLAAGRARSRRIEPRLAHRGLRIASPGVSYKVDQDYREGRRDLTSRARSGGGSSRLRRAVSLFALGVLAAAGLVAGVYAPGGGARSASASAP